MQQGIDSEPGVASLSARTSVACALLGAFVLLAEIALTRLLSVTLYYHYAFAVVALALVGLGWGARGWRRPPDPTSHRCALADACSAAASSLLLLTILLLVVPWRPFVRATVAATESAGAAGWLELAQRYAAPAQLFVLVLLAVVPFAFAGRALASLFAAARGRVAALRAAEAAGGALAGLLAALAMGALGGPGVLTLAALLAAVAGVLLAGPLRDGEGASSRTLGAIVVLGVVLLGALAALGALLPLPPLAALSRSRFALREAAGPLLVGALVLAVELLGRLRVPRRRLRGLALVAGVGLLVLAQWLGPVLRVQYVKAGHIEPRPMRVGWTLDARASLQPGNVFTDGRQKMNFSWGPSPARLDPVPDQLQIQLDALAASPMVRFRGNLDEIAHTQHDITAFAFNLLSPGASVLVVGAGGGRDLLAALAFEAGRVVGLETNPYIVRWVCRDYAAFTGRICDHEKVQLERTEARAWLARSAERFDAIQVSFPDTWAAGPAGAYALTENFLYTREAFASYLEHLSEGGVLSISSFHPLPQAPTIERLFLTALEALEAAGAADPAAHLFLVGTMDPLQPAATLVVSREPFEADAIRTLYQTARSLAFLVLYPGGDKAGEAYEALVPPEARAERLASHPFDIRPVGDDRPFFYLTARMGGMAGPEGTLAFHDNAVALLLPVGLVALFAAVAGALGRWESEEENGQKARGKTTPSGMCSDAAVAAPFLLIGFAFVAMEVGLLQRLALSLGGPGTALTVVLAVLLAAASAGATVAQGVQRARLSAWMRGSAIASTAIVAALAMVLPWMISAGLALPLSVRLVLAMAGLVPGGIALGLLGATALRLVEGTGERRLALAWGASALGAAAAGGAGWVLVIWSGFSAVMLLAAASCAATLLFAHSLARTPSPADVRAE
ncbi:MAG: hypothetical protein V3U98_02470 [Acidobacteriota bacterium]